MMELRMKQCILRADSSALVSLLLDEGLNRVTLAKLDRMVTTDLNGSSLTRVSIVLKSLEKLSENKEHLQTLIRLGLTVKVLSWFDIVYDLLTSDAQICTAPLYSLTDKFYDYILILSKVSLPVSQLSVVLLNLAQFALETKLYFPLRLEAIKTFNNVLLSLSKEKRNVIQNDPNQTQTLCQRMAEAILTAGDYEMQVSLTEALCRLTLKKDRWQRASEWFTCSATRDVFCEIRDRDFEVDCRQFLNFVNGENETGTRIYTFPCLRAFLETTELFRPKDEKLDIFWIDFNPGSGCVSFFIDDPQESLWGSIHLMRENVDDYRVWLKPDECTEGKTILRVHLSLPILHQNCEGQTVELTFNSEHQQHLEEAAYRVFKKEQTPLVQDSDDTSKVLPEKKSGVRGYRGKKQKKTRLKILPLSSPSSDDGTLKLKTPNTAEHLFDQFAHSTPKYSSGGPVGAETQISQNESKKSVDVPLLKKAVVVLDRKRAVLDSGYLSDQHESVSAHKKRAGPHVEWEESSLSMAELSPERLELGADEEVGLLNEQTDPGEKGEEPKLDLTSGITAAFDTFKTNLEQHFTSCWQNIQDEVVLSLNECQQHMTDLLTAVHKHRLLLLQRFEVSVNDQLKQLQESSESLNSINTELLSFFQSEMKRLDSFCDEHLHRLKSTESGTSSK
ncbi:synaptonemal complex protein 2-like isoform X1 [Halichoeres trimaculatus]|uniref:synaptonemal complex protein 2-like isoform X1 n=1 Tax=Halichoeres trimaculatus TaxID=147232 RepID=UPI003D9ED397